MERAKKYSFQAQYSAEDGGYIALSPEFPGLSAYGETPEAAVREAGIAMELFIEEFVKQEKSLPEPGVLK